MSYNDNKQSTQTQRLLHAGVAEPFAGLEQALIVHVAAADAFALAHVPGALHITPGELVCGVPPAPGKLPPSDALATTLQRITYAKDRDIIVYDDEGGGWAGRFIWTLEVIGHERWFYLDGGIHAWAAAGNPIATGMAQDPAVGQPPTIHYDPAFIAQLDDLLASLKSAEPVQIWDARSYAEHIGERSGSARPGRIPGSRHLDWLELMDRDNSLCLRRDIDALIRSRGIDLSEPLVVHCQTHHRSGLAYLVARLLGATQVQGYDGSWAEWGNRSDTPIDNGPPAP